MTSPIAQDSLGQLTMAVGLVSAAGSVPPRQIIIPRCSAPVSYRKMACFPTASLRLAVSFFVDLRVLPLHIQR